MSSWEASSYNSGIGIPAAVPAAPPPAPNDSSVHRPNYHLPHHHHHHHHIPMHTEMHHGHGMSSIVASPVSGLPGSVVPTESSENHQQQQLQAVVTTHHSQHVLPPPPHGGHLNHHAVHQTSSANNTYVHNPLPGPGQINHHHGAPPPPTMGYPPPPPYSILHPQRTTIGPTIPGPAHPVPSSSHGHLPLPPSIHHPPHVPGVVAPGTPPALNLSPVTTGVSHQLPHGPPAVGVAPLAPPHSYSARPSPLSNLAVGPPSLPSPVPQTPQGPPGVNPFGNGPSGPEHDLPPELLSIGWRKFWSKRENRLYFWNCNTGESLWETPPMPGRPHYTGAAHPMCDPLTDPLGIQFAGAPAASNPTLKRRISSGDAYGNPPIKKFILAGPWDLEISSNVIVGDAAAPKKHLLPPHPEIEQMRAQLMSKLRQCYQTACHSRESIDAPKESLIRWIMAQKVEDIAGIDPVFPNCDTPESEISSCMMRDMLNDVPMKLKKCRYTGDARKQLSKYAEACKRIVETRNTSSNEARKVVKWKVEETFSWLRTANNASYEALHERLIHLQQTCQPHVHAAAKTSVEGICKKMSNFSKQHAQSIREAHLKLVVLREPKEDIEVVKGRFRCYPVTLGPYVFSEAGKLPAVEYMQTDRDHAVLKFKGDTIRVTTQYLQKLEQLYRYNCGEDRKFEFFLVRSYCVLKRYTSFCEDHSSSQRSQGSLPVPVLETIQRNFGVTFECFASPFNCYFRQYCSLYPDIDGYFGSRGNFFGFNPLAGSFQMHPPHCEDVILAAINRAEELLGNSSEPMSFIVFVPETADKDEINPGDKEYSWVQKLESSRWKRKQVSVPAYEHDYRHGALHIVPKSEINVRASHGTLVVWLQNDAGFHEWGPTDVKIDALLDAYRPGRERERDRQELLAPERQNPHQADKAVAAAAAGATVIST